MKNLILLAALLFTVSAIAEMPKYLKGAKVTVTLKSGKTYTYNSEEMAVVPRDTLLVNNGQVKAAEVILKKVANKELIKNRKNRVYGMVGYGNTGNLDTSKNGDITKIETNKDVVGGVGYMRKLNEKISIGIQVQTNGTTSLSIGTDF